MAGTPSRSTVRVMNSPSGELEIIARNGLRFSTLRQTTDSAMRPCQKRPMPPSFEATNASAAARFSNRQRIVASVKPR